MANLTWTISASVGTVEQDSPTLSDAQMDRFLDWLVYAYPQLDGNGDPLPVNNAVKAAAFRDWADAAWAGTKANVLNWEKNEAAQVARDGIGDIV